MAFFNTVDGDPWVMLLRSVQSVQKPLVTSTKVVHSDEPKGHLFADNKRQRPNCVVSVRFSTNTAAPDNDM